MRSLPFSCSRSFVCCVCHFIGFNCFHNRIDFFFRQRRELRDLCITTMDRRIECHTVCLALIMMIKHVCEQVNMFCTITHCTAPYMVLQLDKTV